MGALTLGTVASFVRDIGGACTSVVVGDELLVGGSHEGMVMCWSSTTGEKYWEADIDGPISSISLGGGGLFIASSSSISSLSVETGEILWQSELEGSSDYVSHMGDVVWACSSVYEIEVSDYVESTLWAFDLRGSLLNRWSFEEKCWFLGPHPHEGVVLGLGRPRCGYLRATIREGAVHNELAVDSPVTTGAVGPEGVLFGHSDGKISDLRGSSWPGVGKSVRSLSIIGDTWAYGTEGGSVGSDGWDEGVGGNIDAIVPKPGNIGAWAVSWGEGTSIHGIDNSLTHLEISHPSRINASSHREGMVVLGDEKGGIFSINADFLERRMAEGDFGEGEDDRSAALRKKLRSLRD
tara:strand:+ start:3239 stop:4291 length:1053 start_codon:yes stop_codon:yes gene_type:complete